MIWHVSAPVLDNYIVGQIDRAAAASIETHLTACSDCRSLVPSHGAWLESSWTGVADRVEPPPIGWLESVFVGLGVKSHIARVVLVTPALRLAWLAAVVIAVVFALTAASSGVDEVFGLFLAAAPLIPVAGVALAYGPILDPGHELAMASPIDKFSLLMLRSVAVVVSSVVMLVAAQLIAPSVAGAGAWLLPALALSSITLALATRLTPIVAGAGVSAAWVALMVLTALGGEGPDFAFGGTAQAVYVVLAAVAVAVVVAKRSSFNHRGGPL